MRKLRHKEGKPFAQVTKQPSRNLSPFIVMILMTLAVCHVRRRDLVFSSHSMPMHYALLYVHVLKAGCWS